MKLNIIYLPVFLLLSSCEKAVKIDPPVSELISATVYQDELTANAAIIGIYSVLRNSGIGSDGPGGLTFLTGLNSDELSFSLDNEEYKAFYDNSILPTNSQVSIIWTTGYRAVFLSNSAIEGLNASTILLDEFKQRLIGEAYFLRAFAHFYLMSLFGNIPYVTTTDYVTNNTLSRLSTEEVSNLIISDLEKAKALLPQDYSLYADSRIRANRYVATALLSRIYLFSGNWNKANEQATAVIDNASQYSLQIDLSKSFKMDNSEAIWQFPNHDYRPFTDEAAWFLDQETVQVGLSKLLVNSFETQDLRYSNWIIARDTSFLPYKYKDDGSNGPSDDRQTLLRLAEQYLIRAEARARMDNLTGANSAASDINVIRNRAGLNETTATTKEDILNAIIEERKHELFLEGGHRWLDLKRYKISTPVLKPLKLEWQDSDTLYPIPYSELILNKKLTQNIGY